MKNRTLSKATTFLVVVALVILLVMSPATAARVGTSGSYGASTFESSGAGSYSSSSTFSADGENTVTVISNEAEQIGAGHKHGTTVVGPVTPSLGVTSTASAPGMSTEVTVTGRGTTADTGVAHAGSAVTVRANATGGELATLSGVSVSTDIVSFAEAVTGTKGTGATATSTSGAVDVEASTLDGREASPTFGTTTITNAADDTFNLALDVEGRTTATATVTKKNSEAVAGSGMYAGAGASDETSGIGNYANAGMNSYSSVISGTGTARSSAYGTAEASGAYYNYVDDITIANEAIIDATRTVKTEVNGQNVGPTANLMAIAGMNAASSFAEDSGHIAGFAAYALSNSTGTTSNFIGLAKADAWGTGEARNSWNDTTFGEEMSAYALIDLDAVARTAGTGTSVADSGTFVAGSEFYNELGGTTGYTSRDKSFNITADTITQSTTWAKTNVAGAGTSYNGYADADASVVSRANMNFLGDDGTDFEQGSLDSGAIVVLSSYAKATKLSLAYDDAYAETMAAGGVTDITLDGAPVLNPNAFGANGDVTADLMTYSSMGNVAGAVVFASGTSSATGIVGGGVLSNAAVNGNVGELLTVNENSAASTLGVISSDAAALLPWSSATSEAKVGAVQVTGGNAGQQTDTYLERFQLSASGSTVGAAAFGKANAGARVTLAPGTGQTATGSSHLVQDDPALDNEQIASAFTGGSLYANANTVTGIAGSSAELGGYTVTGNIPDGYDSIDFTESATGMRTNSFGTSLGSCGKVSAGSGIIGGVALADGLNQIDVEASGPILQSESDLYATTTDCITVAGAPKTKRGVPAPLPYAASAGNLGYGINAAGYDGTTVVADGAVFLASEGYITVPVGVKSPVTANAGTRNVFMTNRATVPNGGVYSYNDLDSARTMVNLNGNSLTAPVTSSKFTYHDVRALGPDPTSYYTEIGDSNYDVTEPGAYWVVTGFEGNSYSGLI